MDHHVPRAVTVGLPLRGVDVLTALEDDAHELDDPALLDRAGELGRVLFTQDDDLLAEAVRRQRAGEAFTGVIYAHQLRVSIGQCIRDLELVAKAGEPEDLFQQVLFLRNFIRLSANRESCIPGDTTSSGTASRRDSSLLPTLEDHRVIPVRLCTAR